MDNIKPLLGRPSAYLVQDIQKLRDTPGKWFVVRASRNPNIRQDVTRIRQGKIPVFGEGFEARSTYSEGLYQISARYAKTP